MVQTLTLTAGMAWPRTGHERSRLIESCQACDPELCKPVPLFPAGPRPWSCCLRHW